MDFSCSKCPWLCMLFFNTSLKKKQSHILIAAKGRETWRLSRFTISVHVFIATVEADRVSNKAPPCLNTTGLQNGFVTPQEGDTPAQHWTHSLANKSPPYTSLHRHIPAAVCVLCRLIKLLTGTTSLRYYDSLAATLLTKLLSVQEPSRENLSHFETDANIIPCTETETTQCNQSLSISFTSAFNVSVGQRRRLAG